MRQVTCSECGQYAPMGDTFAVKDETVCKPCCERRAKEAGDPAAFHAVRQADPTICRRCGADTAATLPLIAGLSVCPACETLLRNYPFPKWVKGAAAGLLLLVVFAAVWNLRFVQAVREMRGSLRALGQDDMALADRLAHAAYAHAPESGDLVGLAAYFDAIKSFEADRYAEALASLQKADEVLPESFGVEELIVQARMGVAFDKKDYDAFLSLATKASSKWPQEPMWKVSTASAQACKYAVTGNPLFKEQALATFNQARALSPANDPRLIDSEQRMQHRLATREIIKRAEFIRRFPKGWQNQKEGAL